MAGGGAEAVEEKTAFDVMLNAIGDKKIQVIKAVREITGLGLKEAKEMVDGAPKVVKEKVAKEVAELIKQKGFLKTLVLYLYVMIKIISRFKNVWML